MTTAAVRLDRLQAGLIAWVTGALPDASTLWAPSEYPRAAVAGNLSASVRTLGGPSTSPLGGETRTNATLTLTATLTIVSAPIGEAVGLRASGLSFEHAVAVDGDVTAARDALLVVMAGPVGAPPLISATFAASGGDSIIVSALSLGDLYGLAPLQSLAGLVTVTPTTIQRAVVSTSDVRTYVEVETHSTDKGTRSGAVAALAELMLRRKLPAAQAVFAAHGISLIGTIPPPVDLSGLSGPDWNSRASVSLYVAQIALAAEPSNPIETVRGTMDAQHAAPDTIVTLTPQTLP